MEEIDWLWILLKNVELCVKVIFRDALNNAEKRNGDSQELDYLVEGIFCRAQDKEDVQT